MNSRTGPRVSNKEVPGAKKGVLKLVDRGSESGGQWVGKGGNRDGKRWKVGRIVVENGSERGGKWVSKQKKGLSIAPKGSPQWLKFIHKTI